MPASSSIIRMEPPLPASVRGRVKTAASDIDCLSHGKFQMERGSLPRLRVHADLACVFLNDSVRYGETQARATRLPLTRDVLGGEEGIVNLVDVFRLNACAAVTDIYLHVVTIGRADAQRAAPGGHGVFGVEGQVQEHLLEFAGIAMDERQSGIEFGFNLHPRSLELVQIGRAHA